jgi:RNA polymerase sigma factor (sigma-70 family)
MRLLDDAELLSAYATQHSEEAFATLVERHVSLVHSSALRQMRNPHLAEEITQAVFIILARKAGSLGRETVLAGWLCRTARFVACNALKTEHRRRHREQEAHMNSLLNEPEPDVWPQVAPFLDEAVAQLGEADRNAVVLRFYEQQPLEEVGRVPGLNADAAQKRVGRALEKLRKFFRQRGINTPTAILAGVISTHSVQAAPVALAKSVTVVALAKGATTSGSTLTLIKGALKIMAWTKAKTAVVTSTVVLLAAGTSTVTIKEIQKHRHESQPQQPIIRIAPNGSIRVITPGQLSQLRQSNGQVAVSIGFKIGSGRDAIVRQLEQIHATILKDAPELLLAELQKTPQVAKPMQVELNFLDGKLTRVNFMLPKADALESPLVQPR